MKALVTGGAGFIGRWVVKRLLEDEQEVIILDNLSNGSLRNLLEFNGNPLLRGTITGNIEDAELVANLFRSHGFDICFHLAAGNSVQKSIDNPVAEYSATVLGTLNLVESACQAGSKLVYVSTCMVYDSATSDSGIDENWPVVTRSPYAAAKRAGEDLALSYYHARGADNVVLRPFNVYGPFQKSGGEGGVIAIFLGNSIDGDKLRIYGEGTQTRDFLFVEDCARFIVAAGYSPATCGETINAGFGKDISINALAATIYPNPDQVAHAEHIHPQCEIARLLCNNDKAKRLLGWQPKISLEEGLALTRGWMLGERG